MQGKQLEIEQLLSQEIKNKVGSIGVMERQIYDISKSIDSIRNNFKLENQKTKRTKTIT